MREELDREITKLGYRIGRKDPTALDDAVVLCEQHPENPHVWHTVARAHAARGDRTASIDAEARAMALSPKEPAWYFTRGGYALHIGDHELAVADFSQGLTLSDELNSDYYRGALHFMRAEALVQLGRKAEALADLSHLADDYVFFTTKVRSKAELLVMCGATVPPPKQPEPASSEPPTNSGHLVLGRSMLSESPGEDEAALAVELGEAGLEVIDAVLVKHVGQRSLKAARVIVDALSCDGHSSRDEPRVRLYARRLIALCEAGVIRANGNLYIPTRSEVRLP